MAAARRTFVGAGRSDGGWTTVPRMTAQRSPQRMMWIRNCRSLSSPAVERSPRTSNRRINQAATYLTMRQLSVAARDGAMHHSTGKIDAVLVSGRPQKDLGPASNVENRRPHVKATAVLGCVAIVWLTSWQFAQATLPTPGVMAEARRWAVA
jgi:hypothetical protein